MRERMTHVRRRWNIEVTPLTFHTAMVSEGRILPDRTPLMIRTTAPTNSDRFSSYVERADFLVIVGDGGPTTCQEVPPLVAIARQTRVPVITGIMDTRDAPPLECDLSFLLSAEMGDWITLLAQSAQLRRRLAARRKRSAGGVSAHDRFLLAVQARLAWERSQELDRFVNSLLVPSELNWVMEVGLGR
jgi:hypothetical protein